jgi:hypothetical protein
MDQPEHILKMLIVSLNISISQGRRPLTLNDGQVLHGIILNQELN